MSNDLATRAQQYHEEPRPGKLEVLPCKSCFTIDDLTLAYSPGVAEPCLRIAEDPAASALYTGRGNLVGVISNGTAVLGLGNIGTGTYKTLEMNKAQIEAIKQAKMLLQTLLLLHQVNLIFNLTGGNKNGY